MTFPRATPVGGVWADHDRFNDAFNASGDRHDAPPNLLKSIVNRESSGVYPPAQEPSDRWKRRKRDGTPDLILPFVGIYHSTALNWGCDWQGMMGDPAAQIDCMAKGLARLDRDYGARPVRGPGGTMVVPGRYENAATIYFGGLDALTEVFTDEGGMRSDVYAAKAFADWRALDARAGLPMATPKHYDLRTDYERFGLTQREAETIVAKHSSRNGHRPMFVVLHVQQGTTPGSLRYWLPKDASSTVMIQQDGSILRVIAESLMPWTNGDDKNPNAAGLRAVQAGHGDPNRVSLTIEAEGTTRGEHGPTQIDAIAWQVRSWMTTYGIPIENVIRHSDINTVDAEKVVCPGPYYDKVMAKLKGATPLPAPTPARTFPWPGDLTDADAMMLFGTVATPNFVSGTFSRAWAERFVRTKRAAALRAVHDADGYKLWQLCDGATWKIVDGQRTGKWIGEE